MDGGGFASSETPTTHRGIRERCVQTFLCAMMFGEMKRAKMARSCAGKINTASCKLKLIVGIFKTVFHNEKQAFCYFYACYSNAVGAQELIRNCYTYDI